MLLGSRLDPTHVQVVVLCNNPPDAELTEWWNAWSDGCRDRAQALGITVQVLDFKILDSTFSAAEHRRLTHLPLANVSRD